MSLPVKVITDQLKQHGALTPQEQQIVMIAVSEQNGCEYCVAAHTPLDPQFEAQRWSAKP